MRDPAIIIYTKMVDRKLAVLVFHVQELSIAKKQGNRVGEGKAYANLGVAYYNLGDFQQAIECYTQSLSICKEFGYGKAEGAVSFHLANLYHLVGDFQKAIEYYLQSLSFAEGVGNRTLQGEIYENMGLTYYNLGDFKQAMECHKKDVSITKALGVRAKEGRAYGNLGCDYYSLGDIKQATECHKQDLSVSKKLGDRAGEGRAYSNLGCAFYSLGDFKQALECHKQVLSIAKQHGNRAQKGIAYCNLGIVHSKLGNFKQAIEYHMQQLSIAKELKDKAGEGKAYGNLGIAYSGMGSFKQAIEFLEQDLNIAKQLGDRAGEGVTFGNLGNAYFGLGNLNQAVECHKRQNSIAKEVGDRASEGIAYGNLGSDYFGLGDFRQAIAYHKQHLSIAKEIGDKAGEGTAYGALGNSYRGLRHLKEAIESQKQHLSIAKEVGSKVGEFKAYCMLSGAYQDLRDFEKALEYAKQSLSITKDIGDRSGEVTAEACLGDTYYGLGNFNQAIECHQKSLSIAKEVGDIVREGFAYCSLGLDYESSASFAEALDCYQSSIRLSEKARALLQSEDVWKINFRHLNRDAYTGLWRVLLMNGETDEALCAAEQGRAQALKDILEREYGVDPLFSVSNEPKETISYMLNDLSTPIVFLALDSSVLISFWVLRKGKEIVSKLFEIENGFATLLLESTLKEIGAGVRVKCENRTMDEISDGPQSTGEAVEEIEESATSSVNSLRPLYDVIIGPIEDLLQGDQLIIVPDGQFCLAPYSALSESIRIRTVPSLTALKLIAGAPDDFHSKSGALLVGDPCLDEVPMNLSQLPYAKKEVEMIGKLLRTTPLTGRDATKDEVLKRLKSVALVHIAAHGCAQTGEIVLALDPGRKTEPLRRQDFILTMSDVQAVCLRARLVVLSCCHSGRGEVKSEGVVGMARSFLCAGARSVLVSLWAIDDEATMVFMERFYQHLADGKSTSLALHQAMKSVRESEEFSAVKYWAPFVLIGDDVTLEFGAEK